MEMSAAHVERTSTHTHFSFTHEKNKKNQGAPMKEKDGTSKKKTEAKDVHWEGKKRGKRNQDKLEEVEDLF